VLFNFLQVLALAMSRFHVYSECDSTGESNSTLNLGRLICKRREPQIPSFVYYCERCVRDAVSALVGWREKLELIRRTSQKLRAAQLRLRHGT
jgi:hypothetical protein